MQACPARLTQYLFTEFVHQLVPQHRRLLALSDVVGNKVDRLRRRVVEGLGSACCTFAVKLHIAADQWLPFGFDVCRCGYHDAAKLVGKLLAAYQLGDSGLDSGYCAGLAGCSRARVEDAF